AGAIGFVTDGCVRDLPGLRAVGLPAYCMGITPNSPHRSGPGTIGFPVTIAGHPVSSGDVVVADQDGVVIIPMAALQRVIDRLPAIRQAEAQADQSVREGARLPGFLK
ncbi:MAG: RraA family protein, partial [Betaproteobacteria bacterium]|nr:RraA family protein [Betaproteobacteria bacterium]